MISVLLVDDHDLVRHGIKKLLEDASGIKVVGESKSGEEAVKHARDLAPDVVLMDIRMPGIGGLEATRKLLRANPDIKVLVLSAFDDELFPSRLLQAGAAGYITKGTGVDEMVKAIRSVKAGQLFISPDIAQKLALKHISGQDESPFDGLSERELQVTIMITAGQKVQAIAEKLCVSPKTVNSYRYRIFKKLVIKSDVELTHMALRYGLLDKLNIKTD
ncbi:MAG: two-component system response regulator UvrY [Legionellales bacterium]|nr:two-component system response regulator UvrY [Legionellales bacterium]